MNLIFQVKYLGNTGGCGEGGAEQLQAQEELVQYGFHQLILRGDILDIHVRRDGKINVFPELLRMAAKSVLMLEFLDHLLMLACIAFLILY